MLTMRKLRHALTLPWRLIQGAFLGIVEETNAAFATGRNATDFGGIFRYVLRCYFAPLTGTVKGLCKVWKSSDRR